MMDINNDFHQWSIDFFDKNSLLVVLKMKICQTNN